MAHRLSRSANRRLVALLTSAILTLSWTQPSTCLAESRQRAKPRTDHASGSPVQDNGAIDAIFGTRWSNAAWEYVLDPDGSVRQPRTPHNRGFGVAEPGPTAAISHAARHSRFDFVPTEAATPDISECAPSPLSSDEVARLVAQAASRHGVDVDFALAVASAESRLDRARNSPKGARGPMQLMPATAARLGVSDICDPADNIDGGVRLLRDLFATYRNPLIVAAAYNAGEASVHEHGGVPPFPETVRFVVEVINRQLKLPGLKRETGGDAADPGMVGKATAFIGMNSMGKPRQWVGGVLQF
ncbi:lytic transglycosylase domain-containing protein [Mesorhizobium sp. BR1-1-9]|uniref:lytic transglycosylase domain-containing protein n=1 Tax=Mesorhizobium sp. BR1-1-9 TaxID=2876646 RepID=UPI001CD05905|nr:lytic transglycosylase domain-containing protein [Mesorhizobium sp. BR1-1-9]MBZ9872370.1 lytic transglycosylase domain-containing protein [Mesorhizobium sp. BR1-1-9]